MKRSEYLELLETARRRRLTPAEDALVRAYLAANPAAQPEWEAEQHLNHALRRLPQIPMAGNFTARVLDAAQRPTPSASSPRSASWIERVAAFFRTHPVATATAVVAAALVTVQLYRQRERARVVDSLANLPRIEALQDFEAIVRLGQVRSSADEDLLTALQ